MNNTASTKEISLSGLPGSPGIVIGEASVYQRKNPAISSANLSNSHIEQQVEQFKKARITVENELHNLLERQDDESAVKFIETQLAMINDPDLCDKIETEITEHKRYADSAIKIVFEKYLTIIEEHKQEAIRQRSIDITDVRDRLIQIVNNQYEKDDIKKGAILVARELSPREVIECAEQEISGIIMDHGGTTSHAAIIARSMNIPAVVGLKNATDKIESGHILILDGENGAIFIHPEESTHKEYRTLLEQQTKVDWQSICEKPNQTTDKHPFVLRANIEFSSELDLVQKYKAQGIGLVRTESIYLRQKKFINHQETFYESILEHTRPYSVTIRLLDTGGDKYFGQENEEQNPFLGWRGIRMLLDEEKLLRQQLKGILTIASKFEDRLRILIPMVSTLEEVSRVKNIVRDVKNELKDNGVTLDNDIPLGIMVEVPSVALQAEAFAKHADYLSIGTNDLTQYVLAVDRGNELISRLYDQRHPAVWQIIHQVSEAAEKTNTSLSVCGELASDPIAACCLMGLGINELSMNPGVLPKVKQMLSQHSLKEMQGLSKNVLNSETMDDVNQIFADWS